MAINKKIVLISSGQPSLNPRLVKEADALAGAGYEVTVLYAYWNDWGTRYDHQLLSEKKWGAIRVGGAPEKKRTTWFFSRLIYKISRFMLIKTNSYNSFVDLAMARSSYFLIKATKRYKADLYIAHNLGALPAAAKAATRYKKPYGFDAEDFHRQEIDNDINSPHYKVCSYLEDKYLPSASYLTASSPLIAEKYAQLYNRPITALLNVFPKMPAFPIVQNTNKPLKLFWFSQTIGPGRGLEAVISAIGQTKTTYELHLLGQPVDGYKQQLSQLAQDAGIANYNLYFYEPVKASQLFNMASQFDIGLASETGTCLNRDISLTNKLFTYIQCGLAVAVSKTSAQAAFMAQYPQTGKVYSTAKELSAILSAYNENRELLYQTKKASFKAGQTQLNWENESQKFLNVVENALTTHSKMKAAPTNKWFYGVDSIRFIMAFIVMLSHFENVYAIALKHSAHPLLRNAGYFLANAFDGTSAVIAFFIISGFVIHYPNKNGIPNLTAFWIRRFLRILIPLAVILLVGTQFSHPENAVVWSLYCELIYYALYPLMAKVALSWKVKFLIAYVIAALFICIFSIHDIIAFFKQTNTNYQGYYWQFGPYLTWIVGLPCWLLGVLIAEHIDDLKQASLKKVMFYRVAVYAISCICCFGKFHMHLSYILSMNIFALLLYKWLQTEIVYFKTNPSNPTLEKMGKFSYSLYLCHPLLYVILNLFIINNVFTYPVFILLTIVFAYLFYLTIEKPGHKLARKINTKFNLTAV